MLKLKTIFNKLKLLNPNKYYDYLYPSYTNINKNNIIETKNINKPPDAGVENFIEEKIYLNYDKKMETEIKNST